MQPAARAIYRWLLVLFLPRTLREAHGHDMQMLFAEGIAEARKRGRVEFLRSAASGMMDVASRAPREYWLRSGPVHTQNKEHPVQSFLIDIRQAFRSFARNRGATTLVLATLTLAVAANIAVFTLLDGVFRRPFPFPQADRLVYMNERAPKWNLQYTNINFPDFAVWRDHAKAFESMALFDFANVNVGEAANAERLRSMRVTHDFASVLKVPLLLGRMFSPAEDMPDAPRVVVISAALWKNQFNSDSAVIGKTLRIDNAPHTIVGVFPPRANFPDEAALWLPLRGNPNAQGQNYSFDGIGRLKSGVTISQATQSVTDAHRTIWATRDTAHVVTPLVEPLRDHFVSDFRSAGAALGLSAALVLCIACANVAGTMLARSISRRNEIGIRVALGASGSRVVRQLLTESLALSAMAGVLGSILARIGIELIANNEAMKLPFWARPAIDSTGIIFSVAVVTVAAFLFGLAPALQLRKHVAASSGMAGARSAGSVPERRMLNALVITEVALAATLLICGGLLLKAYNGMRQVDPGFRTDGLATFRISLPSVNYPNAVSQLALYNRVITRLKALPGVDHVGAITCLPLACHNGNFLIAEGAPPPAPGVSDPVVNIRTATADYFSSMGIVLKSGRFFAENEGGSGRYQRVAVVNEQLVKQLWPDKDPIGRRFAFRGDRSINWITVVGVVKDVRHYGLVKPMIPGMYFSTTALDSTDDMGSFGFAVHSSGNADDLLPVIRKAVREVVPDVPLFDVRTMRDNLDRSMAQQRLTALSLAVFAAVALGLAMGGIYAVLSYVVGRRRREIAIRMAVGAQRGQVLQLVLRQGAMLTGIGLCIGVPLAIMGARGLSALLLDVSPGDPLTYTASVVLLACVGMLAAAIPALRASRLEPKMVLSDGA